MRAPKQGTQHSLTCSLQDSVALAMLRSCIDVGKCLLTSPHNAMMRSCLKVGCVPNDTAALPPTGAAATVLGAPVAAGPAPGTNGRADIKHRAWNCFGLAYIQRKAGSATEHH